MDKPVPKQCGKRGQPLLSLADRNNSTGIPVKTITGGRPDKHQLFRIRLPSAQQIFHRIFIQGPVAGSSLLCQHPRWLVHDQHMRILIQDAVFKKIIPSKLRRSNGFLFRKKRSCRFPGKLAEGIIGKPDLYGIARMKLFFSGCLFPVQCDVFLPQHFIQKACRCIFQCTFQYALQLLPLLGGGNDQFFHLFV